MKCKLILRWEYTKPQRVGLSEIEDAAFAIAKQVEQVQKFKSI